MYIKWYFYKDHKINYLISDNKLIKIETYRILLFLNNLMINFLMLSISQKKIISKIEKFIKHPLRYSMHPIYKMTSILTFFSGHHRISYQLPFNLPFTCGMVITIKLFIFANLTQVQ
jgi:hypothetical protein